MSSGTRSKRSASTGGEQEPLLKKMKPHDEDPEAGEPIPVEQAAAAEGMLAGERVPLSSTPKQEPQQQLVAPPMTPMTTTAGTATTTTTTSPTPHTAAEPPETPLTGVSNKRGLASQIDLSNKTPTDPTAFNDYLFAL